MSPCPPRQAHPRPSPDRFQVSPLHRARVWGYNPMYSCLGHPTTPCTMTNVTLVWGPYGDRPASGEKRSHLSASWEINSSVFGPGGNAGGEGQRCTSVSVLTKVFFPLHSFTRSRMPLLQGLLRWRGENGGGEGRRCGPGRRGTIAACLRAAPALGGNVCIRAHDL